MAGAGRYRNKSDEEIQALVSPVKDTTKEFIILDEGVVPWSRACAP